MNKHLNFIKSCILGAIFLLPIGIKAQIQLTINVNNPTCNGYSNGSAAVTATGGTEPYSYTWSNGQTTSTAYSLTAGSYKVTVTDAASKTAVKDVLITQPDVLSANITAQSGACGSSSTQIGSATGGTSPYSYSWKNLATNVMTSGAELTNPTQGSYFLVATDAKGCTANKVANVNSILDVRVRTVDAVCGGTCDGIAEAIVTGGAQPYTYKWSFQDKNTPTIFPLPGGTYTVTVTDANGCTKSATGSVYEPPVLKPNLTSIGVCTNSASAQVNPTGGRAPYTVKWSNGATGTSVTGLTQGVYFVTVTDAAGCTADDRVNVSKQDPINLMFLKTDPTCGLTNGTLEGCIPGGGLGPYTFQWSNGANTQVITNVGAGTYKLVVTDGAGCKDSSTITVKNSTAITGTTNVTTTVCNGSTGMAAVVSVEGGTAPYTYKWSNGATTASISNLSEGTYTVTVTDAIGCQFIPSPMVVKASGSNIIVTPSVTDATCNTSNGKVAFNFSGGKAPYSVKWSGGTNTDNLAAGNYTFTVTDAAGCTQTQLVTIGSKGGVKAAFTATPTNSNSPKCDSVTYKFNSTSTGATTGATYKWLFSNNTTSNTTSTDVTFGGSTADARLIVTSAEGCSDTSKQSFNLNTIKVDVPDTALTCQNTDISITAKNNNSAYPVTYKWTPNTVVVAGATTATPTFKPSTSGKMTAYVDITNELGCTIKDSVVITTLKKDALDTAAISFKQDCETRKITFTNTSPVADRYRWVFGDPTNASAGSTQRNPVYTYGQSGVMTVTLIPTLGCLDTARIKVPVREGAAVSLTTSNDSIVCNANVVALKASSNASKIEWSPNRNFNPITGGSTFNATPTGRMNVYYVRATDANGCTAIDSVIVNNFAINVSYAKTLDACVGVGKQITVTNRTPDILTATWTPTSLIEGSNTVLNPTIKTNADGSVIVKFTNQYKCTLTDTIAVKARSVDAKATVDQEVIYVDDQISLTATPSGTGYTYKWTPTDVANSTSAITKAAPIVDTKYIVEVTDQYGCKDTASVNVKVLTPECSDPYVFVPKAFSPNSDGMNDKVYVRGEYLKSVEFAIYNRWGELVFYTTSMEEGWDGTHKGTPVMPDVYGYYVKGVCKKGETFFTKGNITVMK